MTTEVLQDKHLERARLQWRCRRGMLELDLLLQPFIDNAYDALSHDEKANFQTLLDLPDQELLEYLMLQKPPEEKHLSYVISKIRSTV